MIKYCLVENFLTNGNDKFMALVSNPESKNFNDIITMMIDEGAGLTRPQVLACIERLMQAISFWLQHGYAVNTPLVKFRASITGTFHDEFDTFDPERHQLNIRATPGLRIKDITSACRLERTVVASQSPMLLLFTDVLTGEQNSVASPWSISILRGSLLSFDITDPNQGVFLVPANGTNPAVRVSMYSLIKPQEVHFLFPEVPAGDYNLVVRCLSRNGKEKLVGSLKSTLTVG